MNNNLDKQLSEFVNILNTHGKDSEEVNQWFLNCNDTQLCSLAKEIIHIKYDKLRIKNDEV